MKMIEGFDMVTSTFKKFLCYETAQILHSSVAADYLKIRASKTDEEVLVFYQESRTTQWEKMHNIPPRESRAGSFKCREVLTNNPPIGTGPAF